MNTRLPLFIGGVLYVWLSLYIVLNYIAGASFTTSLQVMGFASVFGVAIVFAAKRIWVGLALGLSVVTLPINIPIMDRLNFLILFTGIVFALVLGERGIKKSPRLSRTRHDLLIYLGMAIILARLLIDRPGSARLGGIGGGGQGYIYLASFFAYWTFSRLKLKEADMRLNLKVALAIAALACFEFYGARLIWARGSGLNLFESPGWLMAALLFGFAFAARREIRSSLLVRLWPILLVLGTMGVSVVSVFRSRLFFAMSIIFSTAALYRKVRWVIPVLLASMLLGLALFMVIPKDKIPAQIQRSLSTFVSIDRDLYLAHAARLEISGELGWQSPFRAAYYELAWKNIQANPLIGKGFAFSFQDVVMALSVLGRGLEDQLTAGALTGNYHNVLLSLTVFCGLPCTLSIALGITWLLVRFIRHARSLPGGIELLYCACLLGYTIPCIGQMVMNGGAIQFFIVCVLLGMMRAVLESAPQQAPVTQVAPLVPSRIRERPVPA